MLGGQSGCITLRLLLGLLNRMVSIELAEPCLDASGQSAMLFFRNNGNLAALLRSFVVLTHGSFMRRKFFLNLRTVVAGSALKVPLGVGEFIRIKAELRLCDFQIIA